MKGADESTSSSPIFFSFGKQNQPPSSFTFEQNHTRSTSPSADIPKQSIEKDEVVQPDLGSAPATVVFRSSDSGTPCGTSRASEASSLDNSLRGLGLDSDVPENVQETPPVIANNNSIAPSIQITLSSSKTTSTKTSFERCDSVVGGMKNLRMRSDSASPLALEEQKLHHSPSPSPSRRRRSGSGVPRRPYQVENEEPPPSIFHSETIQQSLFNTRAVVARMSEALASSTKPHDESSSIKKFRDQAAKLSQFQPPSSRTVGLVGDSGVGKSSLINSLLDKKSLARASNSGTACTCVATEYHYHDSDTFRIQIDYFSKREIREHFEELVKAYQTYLSPSTGASAGVSAEDLEHLKRKSELASSTFRASFGQRLDQNPGVLLSPTAVNILMTWTSEMLPYHSDGADNQHEESFNKPDLFSNRLQELTSVMLGTASAGLWPFIRKLKVYLRAYILSRGLVIADLPGLRDLNSARQNVTERYVRQCDQVFAVARIGRATTDQGVKEVFELARAASLSNIGIICTMSDDIKSNEAKNDWGAEKTRIIEFEEEIATTQAEIVKLKAEIEDFPDNFDDLSDDDAKDFMQISKELQAARKLKAKQEFECKQHIIQLRNSKVEKSLRQTYNSYITGSRLNIACISNAIYWDNREAAAHDARPFLNLSGIPALRSHCIGIVADSHLQATLEYIRDEVPAFIGSVELWLQAGSGTASVERKEQILEAVDAIQEELDKLVSPTSQSFDLSALMKTRFDDQIHAFMDRNCRESRIAAVKASDGWNGWHHASYSAFCRNFGTHCTAKIGSRCWNSEALAKLVFNLNKGWPEFVRTIEDDFKRIKQFIKSVFKHMIDETSKIATNKPKRIILGTLATTLRHRHNLTTRAIDDILDATTTQLAALYTDAISPVRTSIFGQLMEPAYRGCNQEYGSGSDRRRKNIITARIGDTTLFRTHRVHLRARFRSIADDVMERVCEVVTQQVELVEIDLDTLRDDHKILDSERDFGLRQRVEEEIADAKRQMERLCATIAGAVGRELVVRVAE